MTELNVSQLFPGLVHRREPGADVITWSNKETPKNTPLYLAFIGGLFIVIPLALFLTSRLLKDIDSLLNNISVSTGQILFSGFFVVASWAGVLLMLYYLLRLSWTETIKISNEEIRLRYSGLLAPKEKRIPANQIWRLSFERVILGHDRREYRFTLNLFNLDDKREMLAYWIRTEENYQLFLLLKRIFNERGWSVQSKSDYRPNHKRNQKPLKQ